MQNKKRRNQDEKLQYNKRFFAGNEKMCNEYIRAGGTLNEQEEIEYLIKALPASYAQTGDFLYSLTLQQTVELTEAKIRGRNF